jgi:hypothetical protein
MDISPYSVLSALSAGLFMGLILVPFWALMRWIDRGKARRRGAKVAAKVTAMAARFAHDEKALEDSLLAARERQREQH